MLKAVELIEPGTMVFLGISTINLEIAKLIYQKNLNITLVINMIDIMKLFTNESSLTALCLGGSFNRARDGFLGSITTGEKLNIINLMYLFLYSRNRCYAMVSYYYEVDDGSTKKKLLIVVKKLYCCPEGKIKAKMEIMCLTYC